MNKWKTAAIIFIILFVLETSFLVWMLNLGYESIEQEYECIYTTCDGYEQYIYDDIENVCYCYDNHELEKTEYMG